MSNWTPESIRRLNILASVLSAIILLVVVMMRRIHFDTSVDFSFLPKIHSSLNALCGLVLILAYYKIRNGDRANHKRLMILAMFLSLLFLISYVLYHTTSEEVRFCKTGAIRYIYFFFLITHVILSAVSFPFILFTFIRGYTGQFERHKKLARIIFPVWLYICLSGPLCFVMLYPCMKP
ncbi:MAG TPA: DUF420 domain-containing protein [Saprospiraceae bacterium]|nr:DUF420 domain-containing protein [Saprospiraceae bacterium]